MAGLPDGGEAAVNGDLVDDADQAVVTGNSFTSIFTVNWVIVV